MNIAMSNIFFLCVCISAEQDRPVPTAVLVVCRSDVKFWMMALFFVVVFWGGAGNRWSFCDRLFAFILLEYKCDVFAFDVYGRLLCFCLPLVLF